MIEILDMCCAVIAKITNASILGALAPLAAVALLVNALFASVEMVIWGETFPHVVDVVMLLLLLVFYLYHLAFLARIKKG